MIPLNESSNLEFALSIQNCSSKLDKATLFIEAGKYDLALPIVLEGDKATVNLPVLETVLEAGSYGMRLEMVIGGVVYTPFKDKLEFTAPPRITVESKVSKVVEETAPSISVAPKVTVSKVDEKATEKSVELSPDFTSMLQSLIKKSSN